MSKNWCLRFRVCRGSVMQSKYDPIDSTATRLVAMCHRALGRPAPPEVRPGSTARTAAEGVGRRPKARKSPHLPQLCALAVPPD